LAGCSAPPETPTRDLHRLGWTEAFAALHEDLAQRYPYTAWKGIDWEQLRTATAPAVAAADAGGDRAAYEQALRSYLFSIPDALVRLDGGDPEIARRARGGGFGLDVRRTDRGRVIAVRVRPGSAAGAAGIRNEAEIRRWNGVPIDTALAAVSLAGTAHPAATRERRRTLQLAMLTRVPVDSTVTVTYRNLGEVEPRTVLLTARPAPPSPVETSPAKGVTARMLSGGHLYLRLTGGADFDRRGAKEMRDALMAAGEAGATGLVLDLRGFHEGSLETVLRIGGHFLTEETSYETVVAWNESLAAFEAEPSPRTVTPQTPHWDQPVAVLVDGECFGPGETLLLVLRHDPVAHVLGFEGTGASISGGGERLAYRLPEGLRVEIPAARSRDGRGRIQVASDRGLTGGIPPDIRIPWTDALLRARFLDGRDPLLEEARQKLGFGFETR